MLSVGGMMVFPASNDLLTMFVALEVLSLPLYLMCGLARHRRLLSQEAAMKYFLLGAFSSAFFLYGVALLYGATGTLMLPGIRDALAARSDNSMALVGVALLSVGLLFKVGAVPFHSWIPDVYQGAPTPITGFMAAATKVAAFGALLRVVYVALPPLHDQWRPVLWAISILTMAVGTITAVNQTDVKRMLAYSSVAHVGFILTGVIADSPAGLSATLFYLVAYSFSTVGAFAIVGLIRNADGVEDAKLSHWAGLGQRSPIVGVMLSMFLLAFAGIPLTSGFISKLDGIQGRRPGRCGAAGDHRCDRQRDRRVLLRAGDRADVLHRTNRRHTTSGGARHLEQGRHRGVRRGHRGPGHRAAATARPGRPRRPLPAVDGQRRRRHESSRRRRHPGCQKLKTPDWSVPSLKAPESWSPTLPAPELYVPWLAEPVVLFP